MSMSVIDAAFNKAIKEKLIGVLRVYDEFCNENNLGYFACGGTAIGAVRHHGFIPWDDDIDVYMRRSDYERLIKIRDKLPKGFKIAALGDENYIYPFAKLYDENTTLVEYDVFPQCKIGVFIDIFPLDEIPFDLETIKRKKEKYNKLLKQYQNTFRKFKFRHFASLLYHRKFNDAYNLFVITLLLNDSQKQKIKDKFVEYDIDWTNMRGDYLMIHQCIYNLSKEFFPKEWFSSYKYVAFEDYRMRICGGNDLYLTQLFGDYMTPPPIEQQRSHHCHYYLNMKEGLSLDEVMNRLQRGERLVY